MKMRNSGPATLEGCPGLYLVYLSTQVGPQLWASDLFSSAPSRVSFKVLLLPSEAGIGNPPTTSFWDSKNLPGKINLGCHWHPLDWWTPLHPLELQPFFATPWIRDTLEPSWTVAITWTALTQDWWDNTELRWKAGVMNKSFLKQM